jgi:hypothetical protein
MPTVMIRQLDGIVKVIAHTSSQVQREVLLEQAEMILVRARRRYPRRQIARTCAAGPS